MNSTMLQFLSQERPEGTQKAYERFFKKVQAFENEADKPVELFNQMELTNMIITIRPTSKKEVYSDVSLLRKYMEFLVDHNKIRINHAEFITSDFIWNVIKKDLGTKYFNKKQADLYDDMLRCDEELLNNTYYRALFLAIYEGLFTERYKTIYNLRKSNINPKTNQVRIVESNGSQRTIAVSRKLIDLLMETSKITTWKRTHYKAKDGYIELELEGLDNDSIFRFQKRSNQKNQEVALESFFRNKVNVIRKKIGLSIDGQHIFESGIMNHIQKYCEENTEYTLEEIFMSRNLNHIIQWHLDTYGYRQEAKVFKFIMQDYIEIFK